MFLYILCQREICWTTVYEECTKVSFLQKFNVFWCRKWNKWKIYNIHNNSKQPPAIINSWEMQDNSYEMIRMEGRTTFDGHKVNTVPACSWRAFSREDWEVRHSCSSGEGMRPAGVVGPTPHNLACHQLESSLFIIYQMGTQKEFFFM